MGADETNVNTQELFGGCGVVVKVRDWRKRNEIVEAERKRSFLQEILNPVVRSVRCGVLNAGYASRTIHESAAMLLMQRAEELPVTTVIVKTTTAEDLKETLKEFCDIGVAAVSI